MSLRVPTNEPRTVMQFATTQVLGVGKLAVIDVDSAHLQAHGLGMLNREVSETTDTGDGKPFARSGRSFLDAFVRRDTSADDRCGFGRCKA